MNLPERKLRVGGYIIFTSIFFIFFMLEMFFSWRDENLLAKVLLLTFAHTLLIWEPTRFLILSLRKRYPGSVLAKKRLVIAAAVLIPYACFLGFMRIFIEDYSNFWGVPVANFSTFSYTIGISLLFVLLELAVYESVYFFQEWTRTKMEAEELKQLNLTMQMDSLQGQVQPHFLFNSLNTLIGLIEVDQKRAVHFTEHLAYVYRYLLDATEKTLISLEDELDFAKHYFSLLKTRYPEGLYLTINLDDVLEYQVPPLSLQLLVENVVKHNKISKTQPLYIHISFNETKERLVVSNNVQRKSNVETTGKGLLHLRKKFQLLNLPDLQVTDDETFFIVSFPLVKNHWYESVDH